MIVVDLFSGAGGLSEGFAREGFLIAAHVEKERWMCETLKTREAYRHMFSRGDLERYFDYLRSGATYRNFDDKRRDILFSSYSGLEEKINESIICKAFGDPEKEEGVFATDEIIQDIDKALENLEATNVDVVIGGPPCQAFSLIARHFQNKTQDDIKLNLYKYYMQVLNHFQPEVFVFENVLGIKTMAGGAIFDKICSEFNRAGYRLLVAKNKNDVGSGGIYNATEFGVCQSRKRIILIGVKKTLKATYPDFDKYSIYDKADLTTRTAIGDLPCIKAGEGDDTIVLPYPDCKPGNAFHKIMRENSCGVINHKARPNQPRDLEIYKRRISGEFKNYIDLPESLKTHKNQTTFQDRFRVHFWDKTPHTIMAHISKDGHYNIHPDIEQCRSLTVREAARIQSFPDNYKFEGPRTSQYVQVGNAVPPLMAQAIAKAIKEMLK